MTENALYEAIDAIIEREGTTYTNDPTDPGGPTKFGITLQTLRGFRNRPNLTAADVEAMERAEAETIYKHRYITGPQFHRIPDDEMAKVVIDTGVLHGTATATKLLQATIGVTPDGIIGRQTLSALHNPRIDWEPLRLDFIRMRAFREIRLVLRSARQKLGNGAIDRTKLKYLKGWLRRTLDQL